MQAFLLSVHVLAAVVLIGPITVAASLFPRYARAAAFELSPVSAPAYPVAAAMHRISRSYTLPAVAVPVFGVGLAAAMGVLAQSWLVVSMALTALAAALLVGRILPAQTAVLHRLQTDADAVSPGVARDLARLGMLTGLFATVWAVVVVLMIVRPGSSTGV